MQHPIIIKKNIALLQHICKEYSVAKLYVFGSVLTDGFDENESDIDFQVELLELPPLKRGENLIGLWEDLEKIFDRKVDLISTNPIRNPYLRASVLKNRRLIYEEKPEKISS